MATINQIKSKLLEMEGGIFQRLCDDWLHRKGYENINGIGMMQTTNKVVKGTPDSLIIQQDGTYIFAEHTSQDKNLAKKLEGDINKCFDEKKTGITAGSISEIILCHLGTLTTEEINHLTKICKNKFVKLTQYGIDPIALSIQNSYPTLSDLYLNLPLDTGQLLPPEDFITRYGSNNLTTPINNDLLFQDENIEKCISLLENEKLLIVSGPAGVGKTLFCVNLSMKFKENNPELKVFCVFDKGADLHNDITSHFSEPGDYLIFVDDANRLDNRLDYILHYLNELDRNKTFKIIVTVRDYARETVIEKTKNFTTAEELILSSLTDEQIKELAEKLFDIKNHEFLERIVEIAGGNPRLAIMASKVAKETQQIQSISNAASLYDDYFGNNESVKEIVSNDHLMRVACAISFFRKVDKHNEEQSSQINDVFGVQHSEFWESVKTLHKNEMVDLYEDEVVKISDQVLSTYLFYIAVFQNEIIPFSLLISKFYSLQKQRIIDSLNPVINSFDHKIVISKIREQVTKIFHGLKNRNQDESLSFLNSFWFALPTESLSYSKSLIEQIPSSIIDWESEDFEKKNNNSCKDQILSLLSNFRYYGESELNISLELMLNYIEKSKESLDSTINCFTDSYSFKVNDWRYGHAIQKSLIDKLYERMKNGDNYLFSRLFIITANEYLGVEYREHKWAKKNSISILTFRLKPDEYITPIREKIFTGLSHLLNNNIYKEHVNNLLKSYIVKMQFNGKEMSSSDLPALKEHIIIKLNNEDTSHCILVDDLIEKLEALEISFPDSWKKEYQSESLEISNLLLADRTEQKILEMGYEEYNEYRQNSITDYLSAKSLTEISEFFNQCEDLHNALSGRERDYSLGEGLRMVFISLTESHPNDFFKIVSSYIKHDDIFSINPHGIIKYLHEQNNSAELYELITKNSFKCKDYWLTTYFSLIPKKEINTVISDLFISHLKNTDKNSIPRWIDFLQNYISTDEKIHSKVARILLDRSNEDIYFIQPLSNLFNIHSDTFGKWFDLYKDDEEIVTEAYLLSFKLDTHFDYSGECLNILMNHDNDILTKMVDVIYEIEKYPSSHTNMPELVFLWTRENYTDEIDAYAKHIFKKEIRATRIVRDSIFTTLFMRDKKIEEESTITSNKCEFLKKSVVENISDIDYVCFIFEASTHMSADFRIELITLFLSLNKSIDHFQRIDYELTTSSWSGSRVPYIEKEISFLSKIIPHLNSIDLLDHKEYVEQQIQQKKNAIEFEKKRDFLGEF